jgi:hypothetical protein
MKAYSLIPVVLYLLLLRSVSGLSLERPKADGLKSGNQKLVSHESDLPATSQGITRQSERSTNH